jgi:hypothetical protein
LLLNKILLLFEKLLLPSCYHLNFYNSILDSVVLPFNQVVLLLEKLLLPSRHHLNFYNDI